MTQRDENEFLFSEIEELQHFFTLKAKRASQHVNQYILEMYDREPGSLDGAFKFPFHGISAEAQNQRRHVVEEALNGL